MWTVILTSKCASELGKKDRPHIACSVNLNYYQLNVIYVILSTVGGRPNQVTNPMPMGPVNFSNVR